MTVEPSGQERTFPFQYAGEPRYPRISVRGLPTELSAVGYQFLGGATRAPDPPADAGARSRRARSICAAPGAHEGRKGTHHSRSWHALDRGHVRDLVVSLPWTGCDHSAPEELSDANNRVPVCHRQSDRRATRRRRRAGEERAFTFEDAG